MRPLHLKTPVKIIAQTSELSSVLELKRRYNVGPTQIVPVVGQGEASRKPRRSVS